MDTPLPYDKWLRTIRKRDDVAVLYDGKAGRACLGKVVKVRPCFILVEFIPYATQDTNPVRVRFTNGNGWYSHKDSVMTKLFGERGDFYSLCPLDMVRL